MNLGWFGEFEIIDGDERFISFLGYILRFKYPETCSVL